MSLRQVSTDRETATASKNLRGSAELTVVAPIKPGLVSISNPMTYARRLELLLEALFDLRKEAVERTRSGFVGPLEQLQTIHNVHWCIIKDGAPRFGVPTQTSKLLLVVSFDQPWEPYIRRIVDKAGPLLDLIFCHCEGFEGNSSADGYQKFAKFVRDNQSECGYYAAGNPELTVDDQRYLRQFRDLQAEGNQAALPLKAAVDPLAPRRPAPDEGDRLFRLLGELFRTRSLFPDLPVEGSKRTERQFYDAAAVLLVSGFLPLDRDHLQFTKTLLTRLTQRLNSQYRGLGSWYAGLLGRIQPSLHGGAASGNGAAYGGHVAMAPGAGEAPVPPASRDEVLARVQGGILASYPETMMLGCLVLAQFTANAFSNGSAARFLEKLRGYVSPLGRDRVRFNVAFTFQGIRKCLVDPELLKSLPLEFQQGMEARAGLLGDLGLNHPSTWQLPRVNCKSDLAEGTEVPLSTVDLVVMIQMPGDPKSSDDVYLPWSGAHPLVKHVDTLQDDAVRLLHVQELQRYGARFAEGRFKEHFGFVDGLSQPDPLAGPQAPRASRAALGDFLLGQPDSQGARQDLPHDAFADGSFLVLRKLKQDVLAFDTFLKEQAAKLSVAERDLRAKLMGRKPDGCPLAFGAESRPCNNEFDYDEDRGGEGCPLQAHVRRANPRFIEGRSVHDLPTQTPRILRRGFSYGPRYEDKPEAERGLLFMAYNASIAEQFEVIQRWLNGANVTGLYSEQNDPIAGALDSSRQRRFSFRDESGVKNATLDAPFVSLQWGLYLFAPSLAGLEHLRDLAAGNKALEVQAAEADELVKKGKGLIWNLQQLPDQQDPEGLAAQEWKKILEDEGLDDQAQAVWAAIRADGGALKVPYGVLVGSKELAEEVLQNEARYSVREYWGRMEQSFGGMHLGMDRKVDQTEVCPAGHDRAYLAAVKSGDYDRDSKINGYIDQISRAEGFWLARAYALDTFKRAAEAAEGSVETRLSTMDVVLLAEKVIGRLSAYWFGFPETKNLPEQPLEKDAPPSMLISGVPEKLDEPHAYCPYDFTVASQNIFRPNPDAWAVKAAELRGAAIKQTASDFIRAAKGERPHRFINFLANQFDTPELMRRGLVGAVDGFVAATFGSFVSVVDRWIEDEDLLPIQQTFYDALKGLPKPVYPVPKRGPALIGNNDPFFCQIISTLKRRLVPLWVYRRATQKAPLGKTTVQRGDRVIVNLGSAAATDSGVDMLFGGVYDPEKREGMPLHACPGRDMALGSVFGLISAVLEQQNLRREGRFVLSFDRKRAIGLVD